LLVGAHGFGEGNKGGEARIALDLLGHLLEFGERFRLLEVFPRALDIAFDFRIFVGLDDICAEKVADQLLAQRPALHEQAEVGEKTQIFVDGHVAKLPPSFL